MSPSPRPSPTDDPAVRPDAIVAALRTEILSLALPAGATVTEAHVANTYSIARPTARIAIDRLVADGLLERKPHHAAKVRRFEHDDIDDLFVTRAAIEAAAIELLAATSTVPAEALAAHRAIETLTSDAPYTVDDIAFHHALVAGAPSTRLPRLHDLLMGEIELGIAQIDAHRLRSVAEVTREHQDILDAVAAGEVDLAGRLARSHVLSSRDRLIEHYDQTHGR